MAKSAKTSISVLYLLLTSTLIDWQVVRSDSFTVTLTDKAKSFVTYENFNSTKIVRLSFKFKTYCLRCLLLYIDNTNGVSEKKNHLLLTLLKGQLVVNVHKDSSLEDLKRSFKMSRDLNDVEWHQVDITISEKKSSIKVDDTSQKLVDDTITLSSLVYFGGVDSNISVAEKKISYIQRFVGCIGAVSFLHQNGGKAPAHYVSGQETSSGCLNACRETSCENKGKCLNRFTETSCDCIGTGYEGPKCTRAVTDAVSLNKTDYIGVMLQGLQGVFKLKMRFRTRNEEGLLVATSKREKGFYVAIVDGSIRVAIDDKRGFSIGSGTLHDTHWHFLLVTVSHSKIFVDVDGRYNKSSNMGKNVNIMTPPIYIGGLPEAAEEPSQTMPSNFVGCLQEIYVYDINIVYKLHSSYDRRISSTKTLGKKCELKQESLQEALRRIYAEKPKVTKKPWRDDSPTKNGQENSKNKRSGEENSDALKNSKSKSNKGSKDDKSDAPSKLAVENNKDLIAWISSGVVSGTIVLMIITACAIHYFKYKYENIFVSRMNEHEYMQDQHGANNAHMLPKNQAVVFLPDKQMTQVVNL